MGLDYLYARCAELEIENAAAEARVKRLEAKLGMCANHIEDSMNFLKDEGYGDEEEVENEKALIAEVRRVAAGGDE
jgi:hypothetical protein